MNPRTLSTFALAMAVASISHASSLQIQLEQEMTAIRALHKDLLPIKECHYSQKVRAVQSCEYSKLEKQHLSAALTSAGWRYEGSEEIRSWFIHAGETLKFRKDKLLLNFYLYDSETSSDVASLSR
jgi:hypothetical protein